MTPPIRSRCGPMTTTRRTCSSATRKRRIPPCSASISARPPNANATTIVTGLSSCDPVRRTPWGTIIVAEEAGATGGFYEIIDPVSINTPINVSNRDAGHDQRSGAPGQAQGGRQPVVRKLRDQARRDDPLRRRAGAVRRHRRRRHLQVRARRAVSRAADRLRVPQLVALRSRQGVRAARRGGRLLELGPGRRNRQRPLGGGQHRAGAASLMRTATSSFATRRCCRGSPATTGRRTWTSIRSRAEDGVMRACWANTGRMSHAGGSLVENCGGLRRGHVPDRRAAERRGADAADRHDPDGRAVHGRQPQSAACSTTSRSSRTPATSSCSKTARRHRHDLADGHGDARQRSVDLPAGRRRRRHSVGRLRPLRVAARHESSEPTGFIFLGSGESAFVNLQHRSVDEAHGRGSLLKISGFKVKK